MKRPDYNDSGYGNDYEYIMDLERYTDSLELENKRIKDATLELMDRIIEERSERTYDAWDSIMDKHYRSTLSTDLGDGHKERLSLKDDEEVVYLIMNSSRSFGRSEIEIIFKDRDLANKYIKDKEYLYIDTWLIQKKLKLSYDG